MDKKNNNEINVRNLNEVIGLSQKILKILYFILIIVGIYALTLINKEWGIGRFILVFIKILAPFFAGLIIAYLLDPIVKASQKRGINRLISTSIIYIAFIVLMYVVMVSLSPILLEQFNELLVIIPNVFGEIQDWISSLLKNFASTGLDIVAIQKDIADGLQAFVTNLTTDLPETILSLISSLFSGLGSTILALIIGFYILLDFDSTTKNLSSFIPKRYRHDVEKLVRNINESVFSFVKGTLLITLVIFVISLIAFSIIGVKAPALFALFCAVTNIIPYVGPYIGGIPVIAVGFSQSTPIGIAVLIVVLVVQTIESYILHPVVMSKTMKLHPVTILISLLIFGYFFGIIGMIVAAPLISMIKVIMNFFEDKYKWLSYKEKNK